jgi:hypothetical protein
MDAAGRPQPGRHLLAQIGGARGAFAVPRRLPTDANAQRRVERVDRQPRIRLDRQVGRQIVHEL